MPVLPDPESYPAADVLRWLLIDKGQGTNPTANQDWPIFWDQLPDSKRDEAIAVIDGAIQVDGRDHATGIQFHHYGIEIRVRAATGSIAYGKALLIKTALEAIYNESITVGSVSYTINAVSKTMLLRMGKDSPKTQRSVYQIDCMLAMRQVN